MTTIGIWRFSNGKPRLQSHGAEYQPFRDPAEKAQKLKAYQDEMRDFADFLRRRYFGEDITEQEYPVGRAADLLGMRHRTLTSHKNVMITFPDIGRFRERTARQGRVVKELWTFGYTTSGRQPLK